MWTGKKAQQTKYTNGVFFKNSVILKHFRNILFTLKDKVPHILNKHGAKKVQWILVQERKTGRYCLITDLHSSSSIV